MTDKGRRRDRGDHGPGAAHQMFVVMEYLLEKLSLLNCEKVLAKHNIKNLTRHYFVSCPSVMSNPGEQFYLFTIIAAWLINTAGRPFPEPLECDDPTATVSNILAELKAFGVKVDFPPFKLKSGSGEYVCFVLDRLAEEALRRQGFSFKKPEYPKEAEEESVIENDVELSKSMSSVEEEMIGEPDDHEEENMVDLEDLKLHSQRTEINVSSKPAETPHSVTDMVKWNLEVERVLPQLKVTIRKDNKDWRIHVNRMHQHKDGIEIALKEAKTFLKKQQEDIWKTLEKLSSREKYINNQLGHLIHEHRSAQAELSKVKECHQQASGALMERTRTLAEVNDELEKVKHEMEDKNRSMCNGAPVVKLKQSLTNLKLEMVQMDVRIGIMQNELLRAQLGEMSILNRDMHAAGHCEGNL